MPEIRKRRSKHSTHRRNSPIIIGLLLSLFGNVLQYLSLHQKNVELAKKQTEMDQSVHRLRQAETREHDRKDPLEKLLSDLERSKKTLAEQFLAAQADAGVAQMRIRLDCPKSDPESRQKCAYETSFARSSAERARHIEQEQKAVQERIYEERSKLSNLQ